MRPRSFVARCKDENLRNCGLKPPGATGGHIRCLIVLMFRHVAVLAVAVTCCGCAAATGLPEPMFARHAAATCAGNPKDAYFMEDAFESNRSAQETKELRRFAGEALDAMSEPSLACGSIGDSYRVLWMSPFTSSPSFGPLMVRLTQSGTSWKAFGIRLDTFIHQHAEERATTVLSPQASAQAISAVTAFGLWRKRGLLWSDFVEGATWDGGIWIVEGRRGAGYNAVARVNVSTESEEVDLRMVVSVNWWKSVSASSYGL